MAKHEIRKHLKLFHYFKMMSKQMYLGVTIILILQN